MIRDVLAQDKETVMSAAVDCGLFAPEEISVVEAQLEKSLASEGDREEFWLADFDETGHARGVAFCVEETMADRVWNLLFIGVRQEQQGEGLAVHSCCKLSRA